MVQDKMLRVLLLLLSSACVAFGYVNVLLVGPIREIFPFAKHYSKFYNVPCLKQTYDFYPENFVLMSEERKELEDTFTIEIKDYPHKEKKNLNYFISWVKQNSL